jgi:hypothetical protein
VAALLKPPSLASASSSLGGARTAIKFTAAQRLPAILPRMAKVIPFPIRARQDLIRSMVDGLECIHGAAANAFWRQRIGEIVSDMKAKGIEVDAIGRAIHDLQHGIHAELQKRALAQGATG